MSPEKQPITSVLTSRSFGVRAIRLVQRVRPQGLSSFLKFSFTSLIFFSATQLWARDYVFNTLNSEKLEELQVLNKSRETQPVWLVFYEDEFKEEYYFEVPARSTRTVSLDGLKKPEWTFAIVAKSSLVTPFSDKKIWEQNPNTRYEMKLKNSLKIDLEFLNLFPEKQNIKLQYVHASGEILEEKNMKSAGFRKTIQQMETPPNGASLLVIESEHPLLVASQQTLKPSLDTRRNAPQKNKYFLVQNGHGGTSFVAPIDDPELIQLARQEIINPQGFTVFADLETNPQQPNRNFSAPEKNYWSWSIKKVTGLAQVGADWCHAYPEMIERMLQGFLRQEHVCFRGQRIVRELKPHEVEQGILNPRP